MKTKPSRPNGITKQEILDYLIREADLDGLVTVSVREIGDALGIHGSAVSLHVRELARAGLLTIERYGSGFKSMNAIQLSDELGGAS